MYKKNWEENIQGKKASNKFEVMPDFLGLLNFCDDQSKKKDHFYMNVFIWKIKLSLVGDDIRGIKSI